MPHNDLGHFTKANVRAWTKSAIECYKNKLMCNLCTLPNDIKINCSMKPIVIELFKKFGEPEENKEEE